MKPLFAVPPETQDGTLILLDCEETFPCSAYAIHALKVAVENRKRWVRVEKRGHACQYDVNELVAYAERNAGSIPKALVYSRQEHEEAGGHVEQRVPVWAGFSERATPSPQSSDGRVTEGGHVLIEPKGD